MSKCVLRIGYTDYLLMSDQGIATVLKALAGAVECDDERRHGGKLKVGNHHGEIKPIQVSVSPVADTEKLIRRKHYAQPEEQEVTGVPIEEEVIIPRSDRARLPGRPGPLALPAPRNGARFASELFSDGKEGR